MKIYYYKSEIIYCLFEDGFVENNFFKSHKRKFIYCINSNYLFKEFDSFKIRRK